MGVIKLFSICSCNRSTISSAPSGNPNPKNFKILRSESVGVFTILLLEYPDCSNFEGKKICVYRYTKPEVFKNLKYLDPHFCDSGEHISPIARFVPTKTGWNAAISFCTFFQE